MALLARSAWAWLAAPAGLAALLGGCNSGCDSGVATFPPTSSAGGATGTGGGGGAAGGGGAQPCAPKTCPGVDTDCHKRACVEGQCDFTDEPKGAPCTGAGGEKVCDGVGHCVECNESPDCGDQVCKSHKCVAATCSDFSKNGSETDVDCGGECAPCMNGKHCLAPEDCESKFCDLEKTGSCAACGGDDDCKAVADSYCEAGACVPKKVNGDVCGGENECVSGFCPAQDKMCCEAECEGQCQACAKSKTGGDNGTCGTVGKGTDPDKECSKQSPSTCGISGMGCSGDAKSPGCHLYAQGTVCLAGSCDPVKIEQTAAATCSGAGQCVPGLTTSCGAYLCNPGKTACLTSCAGDGDCSQGSYCGGSKCLAKKSQGEPCGGTNQCASGFCVDGVCCAAGCSGLCRACSKTKTGLADGTCSAVAKGTDLDKECSDKGAPSCGANGTGCDGNVQAPSCQVYPPGVVCLASSCDPNKNQQTTASKCDGLGKCVAGATGSCGAYVCNPGKTACLTNCAGDGDCSAGNYCSGNACISKQPPSKPCQGPGECASGFCVDGYCCGSSCKGLCEACSKALSGGVDGTCSLIPAESDPQDECPGVEKCSGQGTCTKSATGEDNCPGQLYQLSVPTSLSLDGNTAYATDGGAVKCGGVGAPDLVYQLDVKQAGSLTITMEQAQGSKLDPMLYGRTTCADVNSTMWCASGQPVKEVLRLHVEPGTYYLFADGSPGTQGAYKLSISLAAPVCGDAILNPGEQCDDGNQDEEDGCLKTCKFGLAGASDKCPGEVLQVPLGLMDPIFGSTVPYLDDYQMKGCKGAVVGGKDRVYQLVAGATGTLTASIGYEADGLTETCVAKGTQDLGCWNRVLYVRTTCTDQDSEIACANTGGVWSAVEKMSFPVVKGGVYSLVLDGYWSGAKNYGTYWLHINLQ
ncbi:MAG: hypothetical protein HY744_22565 [Deltaproteobacteria bacterium]|nr:hypothetical protein [Deltaproteobacteria bacterium]